MPTTISDTPCVICGILESVMHSHHTVPQSRNGKDSLQIILCSSCHNILHAHASYVVSCIRNPKRDRRTTSFWATPEQEQRASRWVEVLVQAFLTDVPNPDSLEHIVSTNLSHDDWQLFKVLAKDLGTSQEKALEYCIKFTLAKKGIKNESKGNSELWFLPVSKPRALF